MTQEQAIALVEALMELNLHFNPETDSFGILEGHIPRADIQPLLNLAGAKIIKCCLSRTYPASGRGRFP